MPVALRKFGLELNRVHQEREKLLIGTEHRLGGEIKDLLDGLDAALWQFTRKAARNAFQNGKITESSWNRIARSVLNTQIMTPFHKFRDAANKVARRFQREAFTDTQRRMKSKFKELYPDVKLWRLPEKKYAELVDDLEFVDSKLELDYLTSGREVKESVWLAEIEHIRGRLLEREITEVKEPLVRTNMPKGAINLVIGTGKIDQDFKLFLRRQFDVGLDTHNLLSSFTTQQIGSMQSLFLAHVRRGIDTGVTRKQFVERFLTEAMTGEERRRLATNTMRTLRTAHQRAATASTSLWSMENKDLITGLRRVADGRPCIACIMLDGVRYPPGATMVDHPNGMCILVPEIKTLRELGFDESKVPPQHRSAFRREAAATPNMKSKFMALSEAEQRKVFANDKLFKLWKDEKLPLESLIVKRNGMFVPASARDVLSRLPKLGGVSNPNASIGFDFTKIKSKPDAISKFFSNVDPTDRANKGRVLVKADDLPSELKRSAKFGDGTELAAKADPEVLVKAEDFIRFHKDSSKAPWYDWNEYARTLGGYMRRGVNRKIYYSIPNGEYTRLLKDISKKVSKIKKTEFVPAKTITEAESRLLRLTTPETARGASFKQGVSFEGLKLDAANSILKAAEDTLGRYGVKVTRWGWKTKKSRSYGTYTPTRNRTSDAIQIQKSLIKKLQAIKTETVTSFNFHKEKALQSAENYLRALRKPGVRNAEKEIEKVLKKIENLKVVKRWATYQEAGDVLYAVVKHECYHAIYFRKKLAARFLENLKKFNVVTKEKFIVSEYGASTTIELFAEVGTAIDLGIKIPASIVKAFIETIRGL